MLLGRPFQMKREVKMANLQEGKSFLFGTLQEGNSCRNTEMHARKTYEVMGKRQICMEVKMIFHLSWVGHFLLISSEVLFSSFQDISR